MHRSRTPLAWRNLTHHLPRLGLAVAGIGFAVLLMFMQLGFRNALFDSTVELVRRLDADLFITSSARYTISVRETFSRRRLAQAESVAGVAGAHPLYIETARGQWKNPHTGFPHPIRVLAFDPNEPVFDLPISAGELAQLRRADAVLFDAKSKSDYGRPQPGMTTELSNQRVRIVGLFELGTDFANDGNVIMGAPAFQRIFGPAGIDLSAVDLGIVRLEEDADPESVKQTLIARLPDDVRVLTRNEFINQELAFWQDSTPIGFVFSLGAAMGFIVGIVICYQIIYADISDHMREYGTLNAMGYQPQYFIGLVLEEAILLSLFGFVPGVIVSSVLYVTLATMTGLMLDLTVGRLIFVLILTMAMCIVSGCLTMRRLLNADPAELF